jgi:outer membrane receptor protein involved in Fe transport
MMTKSNMAGKLSQSRHGVIRRYSLATASLLALSFGADAGRAEEAAAATAAAEEITVTGSRIIRDGYTAPTPVSVVSGVEIQRHAATNLADFVNTLPSIAGSQTPSNSTGFVGGGSASINAINLRNLGTSRTLVLIDGQRSVASATQNTVDINTIPQSLVERIDIVTGGASAAYGSDAVGGVVNFILKKDLEGLRLKGDYGETTYGDGSNYQFSATGGKALLDGRLHIIGNAEYSRFNGIDRVGVRDWQNQGYFQIKNPLYAVGNGQPENYVGYGIGGAQVTPGGLITSGPLKGTYFGPINTSGPNAGYASVNQLTYGPALGQWMIGGDWQYTNSNTVGSTSLAPDETRYGFFGRAEFELSDNVSLFVQGSYNWNRMNSHYLQPQNIGNVTLRTDNAYIPPSIRAALVAAGPTFQMGTTNYGWNVIRTLNTREVIRMVAGAKGKFEVMERPWSWNFYVQQGTADSHETVVDVPNNARVTLAQDAVAAPAGNAAGIPGGTIVCRSTLTSPNNGCVPINRLGTLGAVSPAAYEYITYADPYRNQKLTQRVAALSFSGSPFALPAGDVELAFGAEARSERVSGEVPLEFQSGWLYGNFLPNFGHYNVKEAFAELDVPIIKGLNVNAAGRVTHYSTSGTVGTWKVGATYQIIEDLKLRGTLSSDIRAPNLAELFAAGSQRTNNVVINGQSYAFLGTTSGNPNLRPEKAKSYNLGFVASPRWAPGLNLSFDYYKIKITEAIGSLTSQDVADLCYRQNIQEQCDAIGGRVFDAAGNLVSIATIQFMPFNFSRQTTKGFDIEAGYHTNLNEISSSLPGRINLRGMATHYISNVSDPGIGFPVDSAGTAARGEGTVASPSWIYRLSGTYQAGPWEYTFTMRGVSSGKVNNSFIECATACPASTPEHQTINNNHVPGNRVFDLSISHDFAVGGLDSKLQLVIRNIFNKDPPLVPNTVSAASTTAFTASSPYFDLLGRVFKLSLQVDF